MAKRFTDLEVEEVSLVSDPANPKAKVKLLKARAATKKDDITMDERNDNVIVKASGSACRLCDASVADADRYCRNCGAPFYKSEKDNSTMKTDEIKETPAPAPAPVAEPAVKAEDVQKAIEAALEKTRTENEELKKRLAANERTLKVAEVRKRVDETMKAIPGDAAELTEQLVALGEKDGELAKAMEARLVSASALIEKGTVLKQIGDHTAPVESDVDTKVNALVKAKLAENPKLSKHAAEAAVWRENPELYDEYNAEQASKKSAK